MRKRRKYKVWRGNEIHKPIVFYVDAEGCDVVVARGMTRRIAEFLRDRLNERELA